MRGGAASWPSLAAVAVCGGVQEAQSLKIPREALAFPGLAGPALPCAGRTQEQRREASSSPCVLVSQSLLAFAARAPRDMTSHHLWLADLDEETRSVFATAFLYSSNNSYRVSTDRFLSALPGANKEQMKRLCRDAQTELNFIVPTDIPETLPADWQENICFGRCIERTLHKSGPGTNLVSFLKLLCTTATRLKCIVDCNLPVDAYFSIRLQPPALVAAPFEPPLPPLQSKQPGFPLATQDPDRWQCHRASALSIDDSLAEDVLHVLMSKASSIESLRKFKTVCKSWRQSARQTLCDVDWLTANQISLHSLLKKGNPTPRLALALATARPKCMFERDGEGLLPLQYAAAYRKDAYLVAALREATASQVGWGADLAGKARSIKSQLRPVRTHVAHAPIAA